MVQPLCACPLTPFLLTCSQNVTLNGCGLHRFGYLLSQAGGGARWSNEYLRIPMSTPSPARRKKYSHLQLVGHTKRLFSGVYERANAFRCCSASGYVCIIRFKAAWLKRTHSNVSEVLFQWSLHHSLPFIQSAVRRSYLISDGNAFCSAWSSMTHTVQQILFSSSSNSTSRGPCPSTSPFFLQLSLLGREGRSETTPESDSNPRGMLR